MCGDGRTIELIRGTTFTLEIKLRQNGEAYRLSENEILRFGVKKSPEEKSYLIRKDITAADYDGALGGYPLTILPGDTEAIAPGQYCYDIGIQPDSINYYMIFPASPLILAGNITGRAENGTA